MEFRFEISMNAIAKIKQIENKTNKHKRLVSQMRSEAAKTKQRDRIPLCFAFYCSFLTGATKFLTRGNCAKRDEFTFFQNNGFGSSWCGVADVSSAIAAMTSSTRRRTDNGSNHSWKWNRS